MSKKDNGGHAFPCAGSEHGYPEAGMSLRDYFAAKALQGQLSALDAAGLNYANTRFISEAAYAFADAMLAERAK